MVKTKCWPTCHTRPAQRSHPSLRRTWRDDGDGSANDIPICYLNKATGTKRARLFMTPTAVCVRSVPPTSHPSRNVACSDH